MLLAGGDVRGPQHGEPVERPDGSRYLGQPPPALPHGNRGRALEHELDPVIGGSERWRGSELAGTAMREDGPFELRRVRVARGAREVGEAGGNGGARVGAALRTVALGSRDARLQRVDALGDLVQAARQRQDAKRLHRRLALLFQAALDAVAIPAEDSLNQHDRRRVVAVRLAIEAEQLARQGRVHAVNGRPHGVDVDDAARRIR